MKKIKLAFILLFVVSFFGLKAQVPTAAPDVMLQGFYWDSYSATTYGNTKWATLTSNANDLALYFDLIWLPPSGMGDGTGYHPRQYSNQNNSFGSVKELKTLISTFKANGCRSIADIVLNHRGNANSWCDFFAEDFGSYGTFRLTAEHICKDDEVNSSASAGSCKGKATGGYDYNWNKSDSYWGGYAAARDLDHSNVYVQNMSKAYLQWLKSEIGYDGWRYDVAKGYEPKYFGMYNDAASAYMSVGEYWDGGYDPLMAWVNGTGKRSTVFDFSNKYDALNRGIAVGDYSKLAWQYNGANQPAGLIHNPESKKFACTFVDNHDTFRDGSKYTGDVLQAYAFLLASPGIPCVFYPHWYANKAALKLMIEARKAVGLHSESAVTVNQSSSSIYVATATGQNGFLVVKVGPGSYSGPGADYSLACSGNNYAMWIKLNGKAQPKLSVTPIGGNYPQGVSVTMNATQGAKIYYTTDGSTPTASSALYSAPIAVTGQQTIKAIAINGTASAKVISHQYTTQVIDYGPIEVRFKQPEEWTKVNLWAWETVEGKDVNIFTEPWPGKTITDLGDGWWAYKFDAKYKVVHLLFNNGVAVGTAQTGDTKDIEKSTCFEFAGAGLPAKVVENCGLVGIDDVEQSQRILSLYPNPATDYLSVKSLDPIASITITALNGSRVYTSTSAQESVQVSSFQQGVYLITAILEDGRVIRDKFVKR